MTTGSTPSQRPRQSDIARELGISQATVSLVLNGRADESGVAVGTRDRVLAAAEEMGYVPDSAARRLAGGASGLLGVYTFESVFPREVHDFYLPFLQGIEEEAERVGVDLVLFTSAGTQRSLFGQRHNRLRIADGAILLGQKTNRDELARLRSENFPFVHIGRRESKGQAIPYVAADYAQASQLVFEHLAELGHHHVAYFTPDIADEPTTDRVLGWQRSVRVSRLDDTLRFRHEVGDLPDELVSGAADAGATAFVAHRSEDALRILRVLTARGLELGRDYSLAALDEPSALEEPGVLGGRTLTGIRSPRRAIGAAAVSALLRVIQEGTSVVPQVLMGCSLVAGSSTFSAPQSRHHSQMEG